jgi:hypothetical protein
MLGIPYNLNVGSGGSKSRKATRPLFTDCKVTTDSSSFHARNETANTQQLHSIHHRFNEGYTTTTATTTSTATTPKQLQYAREHRFQHSLPYQPHHSHVLCTPRVPLLQRHEPNCHTISQYTPGVPDVPPWRAL